MIIDMINVLCLYLFNICLVFLIFYMLYRLVMTGRTPSSGGGRGRGRPTKHDLPPRTRTAPITSSTPASTTPVGGSSVSPGPHTPEFVMIPNPGYHNSEP